MLHRCISWCILLIFFCLSITCNPIIVKSLQVTKHNPPSLSVLSLIVLLQQDYNETLICELALMWKDNLIFIDNIFIALKKIWCDSPCIVIVLDKTCQMVKHLSQIEDKAVSVMTHLSDIINWTIFRTNQIRKVVLRIKNMMRYDNNSTQAISINPDFSFISSALTKCVEHTVVDNILSMIVHVKSFGDKILMIKILSFIRSWLQIDNTRNNAIFNRILDWTSQVDNSSHAVSMIASLSCINWWNLNKIQSDDFFHRVMDLTNHVDNPQDAALMMSTLSPFRFLFSDNEAKKIPENLKKIIEHVETSQDAVSMMKALSCDNGWRIKHRHLFDIHLDIQDTTLLIDQVNTSHHAVLMMNALYHIKVDLEEHQREEFCGKKINLINQVNNLSDAVLMMKALSELSWSRQHQTPIDHLFILIKTTIDNSSNTLQQKLSIFKDLSSSNWLLSETQRDELFNKLLDWFDQVTTSSDAVIMITQLSAFKSLFFGTNNNEKLINKITLCVNHVKTSQDAVSMMKALNRINWFVFQESLLTPLWELIPKLIDHVNTSQDAVSMIEAMNVFTSDAYLSIFRASLFIKISNLISHAESFQHVVKMMSVMVEKEPYWFDIFGKILHLIDEAKNSQEAVSMIQSLSSINWSKENHLSELESKITNLISKVDNFTDAVTMISTGWRFNTDQKEKLFHTILNSITQVNDAKNAISMMMELSRLDRMRLEENQFEDFVVKLHHAIALVENPQDVLSMTLVLCLMIHSFSMNWLNFERSQIQQIFNHIKNLIDLVNTPENAVSMIEQLSVFNWSILTKTQIDEFFNKIEYLIKQIQNAQDKKLMMKTLSRSNWSILNPTKLDELLNHLK